MPAVVRGGRRQKSGAAAPKTRGGRQPAPRNAPATPAKDEQVIRGRNPFDGATVVNLSPAVADQLGLDPFLGRGVLVTGITRGFAMNAGLRPGDIVRRVNGRDIDSVRDLTSLVAASDRQWQVTIERAGQEITANFRT